VVFKRAFTAEGRVIVSHHFRQAMVDATDPFAMEDVLSVRAQGAIGRPPEQDVRTGEWAYRVVGPDCAGRALAVIFVPLGPNAIKLVTGFHTR
jgi:hypothetical protein